MGKKADDLNPGKSNLDDIVFESREKSYGAYYLRRIHAKVITVSFLIALAIFLIVSLSFLYVSYYRQLHQIDDVRLIGSMEFQKDLDDLLKNSLPAPPRTENNEDNQSLRVVDSVKQTIKKKELEKIDTLSLNTDTASRITDAMSDATNDQTGGNGYMFYEVDEMPQFPGGINALKAYLSKHTTYPVEAMDRRISGTVLVSFCIGADGTVSNVGVVQPLNPILDSVSVDAIRKMPLWKPGKQRGRNVKVWYTIPINFVPVRG